MSPHPAIALAAIILGSLAACAPQENPNVLASWQGGEITASLLDDLLSSLPSSRRQPPSGQALESWLEERIGDLVLPQALLLRGQESGLGQEPALLLRSRFLTSQQWGRNFLRTRCPDEEVPDSELRKVFEESYSQKPKPWILLRHIYKRSLPATSDEERKKVRREMESIERQVRGGASFLEMARRSSDSETAKDGGLIGRISRQAPLDPLVRNTAWSLEDGEISNIVEVKNGFHLLLRESSGAEAPVSFEDARETLQQQQALKRRERCGQEVLLQLGQDTPVTIDRAALSSDDETATALQVGEESFSLGELSGLSQAGTPLALIPRPGESLRHFAEAMLLSQEALKEDPTQAALFDQAVQQARQTLLQEAQWRVERRALIEDLPEAEIVSYFNAHKERFETDLILDLGMILVSSQGTPGRRGALESVQEVAERLGKGARFEDLAMEHSEHGSREIGGRLGPLPVPRLRIILGSKGISQASQLQVGEVSPPVLIHETPSAAYALLKLHERRPPQPRSFEEAREDVATSMAQSRIQQLDQEVRQKVLSEVELRTHQAALNSYLAGLRD
ncbi:MAG: peptidylprolyl isomerase [Deltaproteobacteria bacterium]|nr:peptidylprolyl isomerase [Deltaproteobacteria bacterium]